MTSHGRDRPLVRAALLHATGFDAGLLKDLLHQAPAGETGLQQIGAYKGGEPQPSRPAKEVRAVVHMGEHQR